jgi:hypothetical protein
MAEASEEGLGSQWAVVPMMMMMNRTNKMHSLLSVYYDK